MENVVSGNVGKEKVLTERYTQFLIQNSFVIINDIVKN